MIHGDMSPMQLIKHTQQAFDLSRGRNLEKVYVSYKLNGETFNLTGHDILKLADESGLTPEFHLLEDIQRFAEPKGMQKLSAGFEKTPMTKLGKFASERTSSVGRLAQFIFEMKKPENLAIAQSQSHLRAIARDHVLEAHPDVTGLAPFERKNLTRIFPFYNWWRQTLSRIAIGMVKHPVISMLPIKANYAWATAAGNEPPTWADQWNEGKFPYPNFLEENILGPVTAGGTRFSLSTPVESLFGPEGLGSLGVEGMPGSNPGMNMAGGIVRGAMGMTSPFMTAPVEAMLGQDFGTGQVISDKGEWWDQQLPLVGDASKIAGVDIAGTTGSLFTGAPTLDPYRNISRDKQSPIFNPALVNYLFGVGMTDTHKDVYGKIGHREGA
jgi:hypothetical protein